MDFSEAVSLCYSFSEAFHALTDTNGIAVVGKNFLDTQVADDDVGLALDQAVSV